MRLLLERIAKTDKYTIGNLYIDGEWFCNTLEDTDRNLTQNMSLEEIRKLKIYGQTAIPIGTYKINMSVVSPKFKSRAWAKPYNGMIPRLENVPGYEGVLIHPGNSADDSIGCILVGYNTVKGQVLRSQDTFHKLMNVLTKGKDISITIQ